MRTRLLWRATLGGYLRKLNFRIVCRELSLPDTPLPKGRRSPVKEGEDFELQHFSHEDVNRFKGVFPASKIRQLHQYVNHPETDLVGRIRNDGPAWCYVVHAACAMKDVEFQYELQLVEGRDILQFDGWVDPEFRGLMIGILGMNSTNKLRRAEGFERVYATVLDQDQPSVRLHKRLGYERVGSIRHIQILCFKFNKITWLEGKKPRENRVFADGGAKLFQLKKGRKYSSEIDRKV
jgi:hypothetical protein